MLDNLFKSKIDNVSKRSMTDDEAESYLIALYFSTISLDKTKKV